jgi:hypothetical protein
VRLSPFIAATALFAAVPVTDAVAQTASNLKCRGCVGKRDLGKKSVVTRTIKKGAVKAKSIRDGAIEESKLADGAVTPDKLTDGAKPAGAGFASRLNEGIELGQADTTIESVQVTAPGNGFVVVIAGGLLVFDGSNKLGCSLTTGTTFDDTSGILLSGDTSNERLYARTRIFPATKGTGTYRLVCLKDGVSSVQMANLEMTALFVPASY